MKHRQGMHGAADEQPDKIDIITINKIKGKKTEHRCRICNNPLEPPISCCCCVYVLVVSIIRINLFLFLIWLLVKYNNYNCYSFVICLMIAISLASMRISFRSLMRPHFHIFYKAYQILKKLLSILKKTSEDFETA